MSLSDEQKRLRLNGVCGSEIGAVAGLSPFDTPLGVYLTKRGERTVEETRPMLRGQFLEDGLARWYAEEMGVEEMSEPGTLVHPRNRLIIATPDRLVKRKGERVALEIKSPGSHAQGWGQRGTDNIPPYILAQAHWEMAVLEVEQCDVAALLDDDLAIFPVRWNQQFYGCLVEAAERFWVDHVLTGIPPDAEASDADLLKATLPRSQRPRIQIPSDMVEVINTFRKVRGEFKALETQHDALVNRLKQIIGDAEGIETPWGSISWKSNRPSIATDWKVVAQELQAAIALRASVHPELRALHEEVSAIVERNTSEKPGARPFVVRLEEV